MHSLYYLHFRKSILVIIVCLFSSIAYGQTNEPLIKKFGGNKKFGYVDKNGKQKVDFIYDTATDFDGDVYAEVTKGSNWGLINSQGLEVRPLKFLTIERKDNSEDIVDTEGKSVLPLSLKGKKVEIEGFELYTYVSLYFNRALIRVDEKYEGLYDCEQRKFIIPLAYQEIEGIGFSEPIGLPRKNAIGEQRPVIPNIDGFLLRIERTKDPNAKKSEFAMVDFNNLVLVPFGKYSDIEYYESDGLIEVEKNEKKGFIDCKGVEVIKPTYESTGTVTGGLISVQDVKTDLYGLINYEGKQILDFQFKEIKCNQNYFVNGLCAVKNTDNKWGFINLSGVPVINYKYADVTPFLGSYATVEVDSYNWQLINKNGENIALKYEFNEGDLKRGYIEENGNMIILRGSGKDLRLEQKDEAGKLEEWAAGDQPYLINFLHCKRAYYLELLTFDIPNKKHIRLIVSENGKFEYRISPMDLEESK